MNETCKGDVWFIWADRGLVVIGGTFHGIGQYGTLTAFSK